MPRFTSWHKIADWDWWFVTARGHAGPACYELGIGYRRDRVRVVYVGETSNERSRLRGYARLGNHIPLRINAELRAGKFLYYRAQKLPTKAAAKRRQDKLIDRRIAEGRPYEWNVHRNTARWLRDPVGRR